MKRPYQMLAGSIGAVTLLTTGTLAFAQSSASTSTSNTTPVAPSQECIRAMVALDDLHLSLYDTQVASQKQMLLAKRNALAAIGDMADPTARQDALKQMHEDMRAAKEAFMTEPSAEMQTAMETMRTACAGAMNFRGMHKLGHMMMGGMHPRGMMVRTFEKPLQQ